MADVTSAPQEIGESPYVRAGGCARSDLALRQLCECEGPAVRGRLSALLVMVAALNGSAATAATLTNLPSNQRNVILTFDGDIAKGDAELMAGLIKTANDDGRIVAAVRFNSPGGNLVEAVKLAELIRQAHLPTTIPTGSYCSSACFIAFAAGAQRFVSYGGFIGVHGASDGSGAETVQSGAATVSMARILKDLGVPPVIIGKMVVTPPSEIVWLTADDLRQMGVVMTGRPAETPASRKARPDPTLPDPSAGAVANAPLPAPPEASALYKKAFSAAERGNYSVAARIWLTLAAQGDGPSQYNAGQLYHDGLGVPQNYAEATTWFRRAAEQGLPQAQQNLGIAYALGRGVPQDFVEAHKWLNLSAAKLANEQDREQIARARDMIASRMTPTQLAEAQRLAREWISAHGQ